ncbi:hypothetical protein HMPREF0645_1397 [Hallella bergensis DSM 17361]|uniref:Uncharacterized protein n=1 Tax=Hallella bergensis DSM 17361 TaxID=585502 RepID=D1PWR2_9BACT|nr:hypothetical protein HMPREF0645_1397 [Hallella bergensis DSM 17361]
MWLPPRLPCQRWYKATASYYGTTPLSVHRFQVGAYLRVIPIG